MAADFNSSDEPTGYQREKPLPTPVVVCEIGCNHRGDFETAVRMIGVAAGFCSVDVVKFQKRNARELLTKEEFALPHPDRQHAYGDTYGEHRERLEFDADQHRVLMSECEERGVTYSTSVWDLASAREIVELGPKVMKVPSAVNTHQELLGFLCGEHEGPIHVSLGMTTRGEEEALVEFLGERGRLSDAVLYHCVSAYPVEDEELYLLEIERLVRTYGREVDSIGFSGHHKGIAADVAALALGARYFERHFTLDRTWRGTDHAASLEPDGLRRLTRNLRGVAAALRLKPDSILEVEASSREKLKRNVPLA